MGIEETRVKIVSVADKLFSRFGFQKTSMDEIAKTSRKAKGSLYYHFASKEDLFREVIQNEIMELKAKLTEVVNNPDYNPGGKLKQYMLVRMETLREATNYHETIRAGQYDHFEFIDDIRRDLDTWEKQKISSIIEEGVAQGEFEEEVAEDVLSDILIMIVKGLEIPFFLHERYEEYTPYFDSLAKIILKGLKK